MCALNIYTSFYISLCCKIISCMTLLFPNRQLNLFLPDMAVFSYPFIENVNFQRCLFTSFILDFLKRSFQLPFFPPDQTLYSIWPWVSTQLWVQWAYFHRNTNLLLDCVVLRNILRSIRNYCIHRCPWRKEKKMDPSKIVLVWLWCVF